jgi:RsiW-degrading membrane proteinase PrsW (M82 family)
MDLIYISLAPILIIGLYIFLRDRYEREPLRLLARALFGGIIAVLPVMGTGSLTEMVLSGLSPEASIVYTAFIAAGFTEELFKWLFLFLLFWKNPEFNEKFDGIVYAVFVSLGFAMAENLMYVFYNGFNVGVARAFTAVPAHAMFGVSMGYFIGKARFYPGKRFLFLIASLLLPFLLHGLYDFILMWKLENYLWLFLPFMTFMLLLSFRMIKSLSLRSIYRSDGMGRQNGNFFGI